MFTEIGSQLKITNPSPELMGWCKENLELANPEYQKKVRMHLWTGNTPKKLFLYSMKENTLILPFGCLRSILPLLKGDINKLFKEQQKVDYGGSVPLYDYQEEAVAALLNNHYGILQSPAGSGKGLLLSAKIYTPTGFTRMGDLKIGDEVCNSYGGISHVTNIFDRGKQFCYKLTFTDNTSITCDKDHLWTVRNVRKHNAQWETISAETLYAKGILNQNGERLYEIPLVKPVGFNARKVTIDPWLMGVLLGDGALSGNTIMISNTEPDILNRVRKNIEGELKYKGGTDYYIADAGRIKYRLADYRLLGKKSNEKFIPNDYKYNTVETRLNVLRGLIDTDGSVKGSSVTITSTSQKLMEDCLWIVQSLGGTGKISERQTRYCYKGKRLEGKRSYRLHLKLFSYTPFTSNKHTAKATPRTKYVKEYRRLKSIEITAPQETRCISVDSIDQLFVTDSFIVTHNTQMGIALACNLGVRTLWLTHTKDLLNQSKTRAEQYIDPDKLGTITEGRVNIGETMTFATIQTMCKVDLEQYKDEWDCIIVDECHRVSGTPTAVTQFSKVLNALRARHKYGLSATVHRADGLIKATYAMLGKVVWTVPDEAVASRVMTVEVYPQETGVGISPAFLNTDGTVNYARMISYLTETDYRNQQIVEDLVENRDHYNLILSERVNHLKTLYDMLPPALKMQASVIDGKMTTKALKAEREQAIEDMRIGAKRYLFATYSLAKEGLDIPRLDRLFLVTPQKDYAVIVQSVGRVARTFEGKQQPIVYDYVDNITSLLKSYKKRCTNYRKCGCTIKQ